MPNLGTLANIGLTAYGAKDKAIGMKNKTIAGSAAFKDSNLKNTAMEVTASAEVRALEQKLASLGVAVSREKVAQVRKELFGDPSPAQLMQQKIEQEKEAAWQDYLPLRTAPVGGGTFTTGQLIGQKALGAGALLAGAAAIPLVQRGVSTGADALSRAISKPRHFSSMMEGNPDLANLDPKSVQQSFDTLHRFNPELAADPTVAGSWIRRTVKWDQGNIPIEAVKDLISMRKGIQEGRGDVRLDLSGTKDLLTADKILQNAFTPDSSLAGEKAFSETRAKQQAGTAGTGARTGYTHNQALSDAEEAALNPPKPAPITNINNWIGGGKGKGGKGP